MKTLYTIFLFPLLFWGCQNTSSTLRDPASDGLIVVGKIDSIRSEVLEETRKLWVRVPDSFDPAVPEPRKYPVLYLLDGDGHFYSVAGMIRQLSVVNGNTVTPEMVIVGIPNTDRTRDLTPTHMDSYMGDSVFTRTSGGGDRFLEFLETELLPYVEANYPVTEYRTYVGHSLGGLTTLYTLLRRPELFRNYVAIDPSLWWDDRMVLEMADSVLAEMSFSGKSLYLAVANTMQSGQDFGSIQEDNSPLSDHIRSIKQFAEAADGNQDSGLDFKWRFYPEDTHGSVPLIATYDALRFFFRNYQLDMNELAAMVMGDQEVEKGKIKRLITEHYRQVSDDFGYTVKPAEDMLLGMGYSLLTMKPEISLELFELDMEYYPQSPAGYRAAGDYFLAQGDTVQAMEHFNQALEIKDDPRLREQLKALE